MHIKIITDDPLFEQSVRILKLTYRTGAASKAIKRAVYDCAKKEIEIDILRGQNESMENEIDRLRQLLDLYKDTKLTTKWRHLK
ncbi:MAG: hypothetical protein RPR97_04850 [Colwellia sp.]